MTDRIIALCILCLVFGLPLGVAAVFTGELILDFVFFWPLFMSVLWITGGLYFWFQLERHWPWGEDTPPPTLPGNPLISILIPCFNEEKNARETISAALAQRYANLEVIAINDGSSDNTAQVLQQLAQEEPRLRVIHLAANQGKAVALKAGAAAARGDLLVCIDGDALLDRDTAAWLVAPLIHYPHVGAVTGNPRIRTRSTLIGRIQVGEFSSIIGLIKRTQRIYGRVFTVSGVIAAFRRQALADVGYWSPDMITEDIDISWKLQLRHWDIFFEPRALCWILMPETLKGLWKQRLRWAQGGAEVFLVNLRRLFHWQHHRMWPLFLEYACSTLWAFAYAITILLFILSRLMPLPDNLAVHSLFPPEFTGMLLGLMCLLQFVASLYIERRYEKKVAKSLFWVIWFPMVYWMIGLLTTLVAFPKVMVKRQRSRALGESGPGKRKPVMNENTLILTEHRVLPRLVDAGLTLLAWLGFLFFLYANLLMQFIAPPSPRWESLMDSLNTALVYLLIAALNGWLLILWYHYNRRRARTRRHTAVLALRDDELASSFNVAPQIISEMSRYNLLTVYHDQIGQIIDLKSHALPPPQEESDDA